MWLLDCEVEGFLAVQIYSGDGALCCIRIIEEVIGKVETERDSVTQIRCKRVLYYGQIAAGFDVKSRIHCSRQNIISNAVDVLKLTG